MNRLTAAAAFASAAVLLSAGHVNGGEPASPAASTQSAEERELRGLEEQVRRASLASDVSFFERYWSDHYLRTNSAGHVLGKEQALDNYRKGLLDYNTLDFEDTRVVIEGDTAVVSSRVRVDGQIDGEPIEGEFRHTRVWVRKREGWRIIAYHACQIQSS